MRNKWMVFNVGCIECGVPSDVVGLYATEVEANEVADLLSESLSWRHGGQNIFEVFNLAAPQAAEYAEALAAVQGPQA